MLNIELRFVTMWRISVNLVCCELFTFPVNRFEVQCLRIPFLVIQIIMFLFKGSVTIRSLLKELSNNVHVYYMERHVILHNEFMSMQSTHL